MKTLLKVAGVLVAIVVVLILAGFLLPGKVDVSRSTSINATPQQIYPLIASFKDGWATWNTFDDEDPNIQYSFSGPDMGEGAKQTWKSEKMGNGFMTITKADPAKGIAFDLGMDNGFGLTGTFDMAPEGSATKLTWTDHIEFGANPVMRWMGLVMKPVITKAIDDSLVKLKAKAEAMPVATPAQAAAAAPAPTAK